MTRTPRNLVLVVAAIVASLARHGPVLSAEPVGSKVGTSKTNSSKSLSQAVEEARDSINEGWKKLTDPKTVEPARNKINEAYKELSDAASSALGSSDKSKKGK